MWIGLFSDIHANREALEACLSHARANGIARFIFLGDYVGLEPRNGNDLIAFYAVTGGSANTADVISTQLNR